MAKLKAFRVTGEFRSGRNWKPFSKEFAAASSEECTEMTYSILGSDHRVKRKFINIRNIEHIKKLEDVRDPLVRERLG